MYIRNYHAEMLQRATQAMYDVPASERYISALTLSVGPSTLYRLRQRVLEFRRELISLCDADPAPDRVVQLNLQLFPLTAATDSPPATKRPLPW